jgi:hypothetical protein
MLGNEALYEAALSERGYILAVARTFAPVAKQTVIPLIFRYKLGTGNEK